MTISATLKLLAWLSPAFPTGGFAYSHGIEWAVEAGDIRDGGTLRVWIEDVLRFGAGRSDAILLRAAMLSAPSPLVGLGCEADQGRGAGEPALDLAPPPHPDPPHKGEGEARQGTGFFSLPLVGRVGVGVTTHHGSAPSASPQPPPARGGGELTSLAIALAPSRERLAETLHQGTAFASAASPWGEIPPDLPYPVAVGMLAGAHGIDADTAAGALLQAFAANLISAAVRLVPLGQSTGLAVLAALEPAIAEIVAETRMATLDDIGGACFRSDIAAMRHETQYTRLFRS